MVLLSTISITNDQDRPRYFDVEAIEKPPAGETRGFGARVARGLLSFATGRPALLFVATGNPQADEEADQGEGSK